MTSDEPRLTRIFLLPFRGTSGAETGRNVGTRRYLCMVSNVAHTHTFFLIKFHIIADASLRGKSTVYIIAYFVTLQRSLRL